MKIKLTLLLLFIFNLSFSQTKEEVMEAILEKDYLMYKSPDGFNNISDILKEKFSEEELFEFTSHEKNNLRLAAKLVLIEMNKGNVIDFLTSEIKTNEEIKYIDGAYVDNLNTVSLIYYFYTQNRIMKTLGYLGQKAAERLVFNSTEVKQMNKIIMDSEVALSAYVREKIFKYEKSDKNSQKQENKCKNIKITEKEAQRIATKKGFKTKEENKVELIEKNGICYWEARKIMKSKFISTSPDGGTNRIKYTILLINTSKGKTQKLKEWKDESFSLL